MNSNEHGNINGYQTYPPHKKREVTSHRDSPTFGEIVPSLVHTPVFHGWLPPCPQVLLSSQGPKNCTVLPAACWSRSSWDRITIKILRWFCWLSKILTIPFFFLSFDSLESSLTLGDSGLCLKWWLYKDFVQRLSGQPTEREALVFFYCDPKEVGSI